MVRQKVDERCTTAVAAWAANKNPETKKSALLAMKLHHRFKDGEPGKKSNASSLFSSLCDKYREQHKKTKKKTSERLRTAAVERLKMSNTLAFRKQRAEEDILEEDDADALAELISTTTVPTWCGRTMVDFSGISMEQMVKLVPILPKPTSTDDGDTDDDDDEANEFLFKVLFYFGYTGRLIEEEWLRWLTARGARPTLLWTNGSFITMGDAETELEFERVEVYSSLWKINARGVEAALQKRFQHLPIGQRLWRDADKGAKFDTPSDAGKIHKVFLTYSKIAHQALIHAEIKINK
jgi:hypothetical protein